MQHDHVLRINRLTGLTDGVFSIAMTILVFEVRLPPNAVVSNLPTILTSNISGKILIYAGSFIILGSQWIAINFQHGFLHRVNRHYLWANILFLMTVGIMPFSAHLLMNYPLSSASISFYSLNLIFSSAIQLGVWHCGGHYKLYTQEYKPENRKVVIHRICIPPLFYLASFFIGHWSPRIAFIILIIPPLFYMLPGKLDKYIDKNEI
jgi:uncharacterized membrane protein